MRLLRKHCRRFEICADGKHERSRLGQTTQRLSLGPGVNTLDSEACIVYCSSRRNSRSVFLIAHTVRLVEAIVKLDEKLWGSVSFRSSLKCLELEEAYIITHDKLLGRHTGEEAVHTLHKFFLIARHAYLDA